MLENPAHAQQQRREKVQEVALMEACAEGGAAAARSAFESWQAGATQFKARFHGRRDPRASLIDRSAFNPIR